MEMYQKLFYLVGTLINRSSAQHIKLNYGSVFVGSSAWGKKKKKTQTSKNLKNFAFIIWNPVYWALGKSYGKPELFTSHSLVMGQDRKLKFQLWLGSTLLCFIIITLVWEWNYWWSGAWVPCQHKTSTNKDLVAKIHTSQHTILSFTSDKTYPVFWLAIK